MFVALIASWVFLFTGRISCHATTQKKEISMREKPIKPRRPKNEEKEKREQGFYLSTQQREHKHVHPYDMYKCGLDPAPH